MESELSHEQPKILLIDDTKDVRDAFRALLESENYLFFEAKDGQSGINEAIKVVPDLIFLDIMMPGMDGYETCEKIRKTSSICDTPVIMVTALDDKESKIKGIQSGADDFINKPIDTILFKARVKTITKLNRLKKLKEKELRLEKTLKQTVELLTDLISLSLNQSHDDSERIVQILYYLGDKLKIKNINNLIYAGQLLNIGKLALPKDLLDRFDSENPLPPEESKLYNSHIRTSKSLISKISGFEVVGDIINYSQMRHDELKKIKTTLSHPAFLGHLIFCSKKYDSLIISGNSPKSSVSTMLNQPDKYHPKIVALLKHATPIMYDSSPSMVNVSGLIIGMLCHDDIFSMQDTPILKKGEVINQANLEKIMVFERGFGIKEPIAIQRRKVKNGPK